MVFRSERDDDPNISGGIDENEEVWVRASVRGVFRMDSSAKRIRSASF